MKGAKIADVEGNVRRRIGVEGIDLITNRMEFNYG